MNGWMITVGLAVEVDCLLAVVDVDVAFSLLFLGGIMQWCGDTCYVCCLGCGWEIIFEISKEEWCGVE